MRRTLIPVIVVGVAAALLALLAFGVSHQGTNSSIDNAVARGLRPAAPQATTALPMLGSSRSETLSALRGKVIVLNVFASWCVPCRSEAPILASEQRILAKHDGTVLGVTYLDNSADSENFARQEHISYPVVRDINGNFVRAWGVDGVPETFVIDRQGRIAALRRYQLAGKWLKRTVAPILGESS